MGALAITLLVLGILMLIEGAVTLLFPKWALKTSKWFVKKIEKNFKYFAIGEIIIATILIVIGLRL
tara:strand:- start:410 stop:607 length:198 start_codon:yes stop_codon:yes gene_type:complete